MIVASGARYRRLPVDRLEEFEGNGVYYAATEMERRQCGAVTGRGRRRRELGRAGGDVPLRFRRPVTVVIRGADLGKSMSRYLTDRIDAHPRITVRTEAQITGLVGEPDLRAVRITDADGDDRGPLRGALLLHRGRARRRSWISGCAALDDRGFVLTDRALGARAPRRALGRPGPAAAALRDEPSRAVRRGRRALRLHQAGGGRRRRGIGLRRRGAPVPELRRTECRAPGGRGERSGAARRTR